MLERGKMDRDVIEIVGIDSLVPKDHLLRKIDQAVDFNRIYEMVKPLYSEDNGRPGIPLDSGGSGGGGLPFSYVQLGEA